MTEHQYICCLCGKTCYGWGNNPDPVEPVLVDVGSECCDDCNMNVVIPARIAYIPIAQTVEDRKSYMLADMVIGVREVIDPYTGITYPAGWIGTICDQRKTEVDVYTDTRYFIKGWNNGGGVKSFTLWLTDKDFRLRRR